MPTDQNEQPQNLLAKDTPKPPEGAQKPSLNPESSKGLDIIKAQDSFNPEGALMNLAMKDWGPKPTDATSFNPEGALINNAMDDWDNQKSKKTDTADNKQPVEVTLPARAPEQPVEVTPTTKAPEQPAEVTPSARAPEQPVEFASPARAPEQPAEVVAPVNTNEQPVETAAPATTQEQPAENNEPKEKTAEDKLAEAKQQLDKARHDYVEDGKGIKGWAKMEGSQGLPEKHLQYTEALQNLKNITMEQVRQKLQSDPTMYEKDPETGISPAETLVENTKLEFTSGEWQKVQEEESAVRAEKALSGGPLEKFKNMTMNMVDKYRKSSWKTKLGLGLVAIGGGAALGTSAIVGRRVFGGLVASVGFKESAEAIATKMRDKRMEKLNLDIKEKSTGEDGTIDLDIVDKYLDNQTGNMANKFQNFRTLRGLRTIGAVGSAIGVSLISRTAAQYLGNTEVAQSIKDKMHDFANKDIWRNMGDKVKDIAGRFDPSGPAMASTEADTSNIDKDGNQVPDRHFNGLPDPDAKTPNILKTGGGSSQMNMGEKMVNDALNPVRPPEVAPDNPETQSSAPHEDTQKTRIEHTVKSGDNLWKIIDQKLGENPQLDEGERTHAIDDLKDKFSEMSDKQLKEIGIDSGNIHKLEVGKTIDLTSVMGDTQGIVQEADAISDAKAEAIAENNEKIDKFFAKNPNIAATSGNIDAVLAGKGDTLIDHDTKPASGQKPEFRYASVGDSGEDKQFRASEYNGSPTRSELSPEQYDKGRAEIFGSLETADKYRSLSVEGQRTVFNRLFSFNDSLLDTSFSDQQFNQQEKYAYSRSQMGLPVRDIINGHSGNSYEQKYRSGIADLVKESGAPIGNEPLRHYELRTFADNHEPNTPLREASHRPTMEAKNLSQEQRNQIQVKDADTVKPPDNSPAEHRREAPNSRDVDKNWPDPDQAQAGNSQEPTQHRTDTTRPDQDNTMSAEEQKLQEELKKTEERAQKEIAMEDEMEKKDRAKRIRNMNNYWANKTDWAIKRGINRLFS